MRSAMVAKQIEPVRMAAVRTNGFTMVAPKVSVIRIGMTDMMMPTNADASISPKRMVQTETGLDISLSSVRCAVSQGKATGAIAEQVKKTETAIRPGISDSTGI